MLERTRAEELYDQHRDKVWDDIKSGTEAFDKNMLTFSSGALALSLAFIKDVVPLSKAIWLASLIGSWIAFVICILITLFSFRFSIKALEKTIPALAEHYLERKQDAFNRHLQSVWSKAPRFTLQILERFHISIPDFLESLNVVPIRKEPRSVI
jgi:hypothetical protein